MNREKTIFVTAAGSEIACAVLRCLANAHEQYRIVACDTNPYSQGKIYADVFLMAPGYSDVDAYKSFIMLSCADHNVTHFLPITEKEIRIAASMRDFFQSNGICLLMNNDEIIETGCSRFKTYMLCKKLGIMAPETMLLGNFLNNGGSFGYPAVLKKENENEKNKIQIVESRKNLDEIVDGQDVSDYLIQQQIGTDEEEYTMGVFSDGNVVKSIAFKRRLGYASMSVRAETVIDGKLDEIAEKLAKALQLKGSMNVQMRKSGFEYYVIKINPRLSGSCAFRQLNGFCDVEWWLQLVSGERITYDQYTPEAGKIGIKIMNELVFDKKGSFAKFSE